MESYSTGNSDVPTEMSCYLGGFLRFLTKIPDVPDLDSRYSKTKIPDVPEDDSKHGTTVLPDVPDGDSTCFSREFQIIRRRFGTFTTKIKDVSDLDLRR